MPVTDALAEPVAPATTDVAPPDAPAGDTPAPERPSHVLDLVAAGMVVVFAVGFVSAMHLPAWSPRMAGIVFAIPLGVLLLYRMARHGDRATLFALAALGWATLTAFWQSTPMLHVFGSMSNEASVLIFLGALSCWAIGRWLTDDGRRLLPYVVIGALALNALVGIAQFLVQVEGGPLNLRGDRAQGLTTYSVYFGALMSGAAVLLAALTVPRRYQIAQVAGVGFFAFASSLSGSRAALGAAVLGVLWVVAQRRNLLSVVAAGATVAGTVGGALLQASYGANRSSLQRLTSGSGGDIVGGGISWRLDGWSASIAGWLERPIAGWGVGNHRASVQAHLGDGYRQSSPRFDAHNIVLEWLTTVGVVGALLFAAFAVACIVGARGPMAVAAAVIALNWTLEPAGISTLPLALLLLGAAMPWPSRPSAGRRADRRVLAALATSVVLAGTFVAADLRLSAAIDNSDLETLERYAAVVWFDPTPADLVGQVWLNRFTESAGADSDALREAADWALVAADRQRQAPRWTDSAAARHMVLDDHAAARALLDRSLALQPRRAETWELTLLLAEHTDDQRLAEEAMTVLCDIGHRRCEPGP